MNPVEFEYELRARGFVDPDGEHHEFSQIPPMHGQKVEMGDVEDKDPELFEALIDMTVDYVREVYGEELPEAVVGVANGTNTLALEVAARLGVMGFTTAKTPSGVPTLMATDYYKLREMAPQKVLVLDDVASTGRNTAAVAASVLFQNDDEVGAVEVLYVWKRVQVLERLVELGIVNRAIINTEMATYTAEDCQHYGFCAKKWFLHEYQRKKVSTDERLSVL